MLEDKSLDELRAMADTLGVTYHHKTGAETLRAKINQQQASRVGVAAEALLHPAELPQPVKDVSTEDQVMKLVRPMLAARPGLQIRFVDEPEGHQTWHARFRYKGEEGRGPWKEDSGPMDMPLRSIRDKIEMVSQPVRVAGTLNREFDGGGEKYSDNVLAGGGTL